MNLPKPQRLVTLLLTSHTVLALILAGALGLALAALGEIHGLMGAVREQQLGALSETEELHRAGWAIEVAARHAIEACERGAADTEVAATIEAPLHALRDTMRRFGPRADRRVLAAVARYERFAAAVVARDTCAALRSPDTRRERLRLDEDLTDVWIDRLFELHHAIYQHEEQARRTSDQAIATGAALVLLALLAAALLTRWIARGVTGPLADLARAARRVGRGDFSPIAPARGPVEVVDLSLELDRMRAHLAELDALKQGFVASVSHELRTPLTKLREALALLGDGAAGPLTERQRSVLGIARGACEQEIHLVTTLLDLSRLRAGGPLKLETGQSLDDAVCEAMMAERAEAERRGVAIELSLVGTVPLADLDGPLIERAVANLVRNAVSVAPAGTRVLVTREVLAQGPDGTRGPWGRVRVRDEGPGVPAEARAHLFEPFATHRVPGRPGRVGTGLGLALAREVARAHGGDVQLADEPGPGATFDLWLPLRARDSTAPPPARDAASAPR
jgi:two-component system sensor histidine kinase GlrK